MNNKFYALLNNNGTIISIVDESNLNNYKKNIQPDCIYQEIDIEGLNITQEELEDFYWLNNQWNKRSERPHEYCEWSWDSYSWVNNPSKLYRTAPYLLRVKLEDKLLKLTVEYNGVKYNASSTSSLSMTVALSNLSDTDTILWRDYDNNLQELTKADLQAISELAFNEQQDLLQRYWVKRDEIASITDFDTLLNYNLEL